MKGKTFEVLQKIGKTFMLPIALLPVAGLLLGVGASFTGNAFIKTYHLEGLLNEHTLLFKFLSVLKDCGDIIFVNLPLLFAVSVALGMAKAVKEVAALSAVVAYIMMYASLTSVIDNFLDLNKLEKTSGLIGQVLGFEHTMNTGVFGGIIVGLLVAWLHNKYYKIDLPDALSFFSGTRFIPIVSALAGVGLGFVFAFIWPFFAAGIAALGVLVANLGVVGTFIYGFTYRALIPLGLHHVFYLPFWQTSLGGVATIDGQTIEGAQNILFAQLGAGIPIGPEYAKFFSGMFPFMIFGYPAAAYAMYRQAKPAKKEKTKGLLFSASLTSIFTGITEPLEFSFLFASPFLYFGVHCVLAALSFAIMNLLHVGVGVTFSGGLLDFVLYGILPGQGMTNWIPVVFVGIIYAFVYYFVFTFFIKKFDIKTPGREDDDVETKLHSKQDYLASKDGKVFTDEEKLSYQIVLGLGGNGNLVDVDNCATRLRVNVKNGKLVNQSVLKATGAAGVVVNGNGVQVIYGPKVANIKTNIDEFIAAGHQVALEESLVEDSSNNSVDIIEEKLPSEHKQVSRVPLFSVSNGRVIPIGAVADQVFSQKMMGDGFAVLPSSNDIYSPVRGEIMSIFPTKHALGIKTPEGLELLLHMGLDTVQLDGKPFELCVAEGQVVTETTQLAKVDLKSIQEAGKGLDMIVVVTNMTSDMTIELTNLGTQETIQEIGSVLITK
ncbi:PTS glucose transporter subunit IIABC [Vagococcus penaei]|uniref:PTS glucose transporter subunit IIABC n=1 Tax=Vagococcus penaei TaxID=633807 RepID=A0A1Q2D7Q8_9ENTE|nr:PTS transporter subunit IIABC [Vagococcus penaei]AQP54399.1 PTS glucose transporter subunit IIABC [Vagococcus penaei]RSU06315.1 PTS glucose transporter subunit IIABC [Vagococcus penaei]